MKDYLQSLGFNKKNVNIHLNNPPEDLINKTVELGQGKLANCGALVVETGSHTGRAAKDKYVVESAETKNKIWWENDINKMSRDHFSSLKERLIEHLESGPDIFMTSKSVGANAKHNIGIRLISNRPVYALFTTYLFRDELREFDDGRDYQIIHAPDLKVEKDIYGNHSDTVIALNFDERTVLIAGTRYSGEIKKSAFTIMNYVLPDHDILPMHAGANLQGEDNSSLFFGLSGTGKTTLSTDKGFHLIGDDEHGLSSDGIFNFEGGCYAKTYKLSEESEPEIYRASTKFGSLLENVKLKENGEIDFFNKEITENGRSSYPLSSIEDRVASSSGPIPKNIFFLTADAFGVLPPIAKLNSDKAMYYFILGYTSKLAGTEMGISEPTAAFSPFFGAPFMPRTPNVYAHLLKKYLEEHDIKIWLVNTGWMQGPYGEGQRYPLNVTRSIIRAVQNGELEKTQFELLPYFDLEIPKEIIGVETALLNPKHSWKKPEEYDDKALALVSKFEQCMESISSKGIDFK